MIGPESGKVVNYAVRAKNCRVCSLAENSHSAPPEHDCHVNYCGSAKGMESDMVIDMVKELHDKGEIVEAIVGDEDTTTISRLRATVDKQITKLSDKNHVKKLLGNSLYSIKKDHKSLTIKVIQYLQKCFAQTLSKGKGDSETIAKNVTAMGYHPFGDHSHCSEDWCTFLKNPQAKFKYLPHGRPLTDVRLQSALQDIFTSYAASSDKLASLGSTQANESFNKIVSSKAPKSNHYSSSRSLMHRVAASVAQKNEGQKYILDVSFLR